jgi:hypothetical protein
VSTTNDLPVTQAWVDRVPHKTSIYWDEVRAQARCLGTDGCTMSPDVYVDACYEHDIHWRTGKTIEGRPITTRLANRRLRKVMESRSPLGARSVIARIYHYGVIIGARFMNHKSS